MSSISFLLILILFFHSIFTTPSKKSFFNSIPKVQKAIKLRSTLVKNDSLIDVQSLTFDELIKKRPKKSGIRHLVLKNMMGNLFKSKAEKEADLIRIEMKKVRNRVSDLEAANHLGRFLNSDLLSTIQELQQVMDRYADLDQEIERMMGDGSQELLRIC